MAIAESEIDVAKRKARKPSHMAKGVDFSVPLGEPALIAPDSVSWRVFKNPISVFIGGIAAVILEFAEPRVRSGVWDHSSFVRDPRGRLQRTGRAAMITVYGPASLAEQVTAGVRRMHDRVVGETPAGVAYRANDPELLNWVQATASFGFLEAYNLYVKPLSRAERDRFYAESKASGSLFGATHVAGSVDELEAMFDAMRPTFEASDIVFQFLDIMHKAPLLPGPSRLMQGLLVRAAVEMTPRDVRDVLGLDRRYGLPFWGRHVVRLLGGLSDKIVLPDEPPAQACKRLGLPANYLYR